MLQAVVGRLGEDKFYFYRHYLDRFVRLLSLLDLVRGLVTNPSD